MIATTRSTVRSCHKGKSLILLSRGCLVFEGCCGASETAEERNKGEKWRFYFLTVWGFYGPAWLWLGGKRSRENEPARATLNAQSTRHGARPGPKVAPSARASPLRASQPRAREVLANVQNKVHFIHEHILKSVLWVYGPDYGDELMRQQQQSTTKAQLPYLESGGKSDKWLRSVGP